ncbi:hypothetical protein SCP_0300950 [Sparassis crispa]|uniref:Uncharacterized protein n=1 Tax=Sparassis crispa TaxID=139825 RepID=A0A401GDY5_9APHY|nr:hypothetical protein SCP_0300950 [Sparassis crispa]GBE80380.1 hypothetical protein SCP_0300950 [Sparassis crispa]
MHYSFIFPSLLIGARLRRLFLLRRRCLRDEAKAKAEDKDEDEDMDEDGDVARDQCWGSPIRTIPLIEQYTMEEMPGRADEVSPFDGLLATEFPLRDDGVIITPNASYIPKFPAVLNGQMATQHDGRWGPQEYLRWPQMFDQKVIHHMCIPGMAAVLEADAMVLWDKIRLWEWEVDSTCSVPDLGFLTEEKFNALAEAALRVMDNFTRQLGRATSEKMKPGQQLILMLGQCLDRLHLLPMTCTHVIALGAHMQHLTLKLWGFVNYYNVVVGRLEMPTLHRKPDWDILPVRGAFTNDANVVHSLFCVGIPFWFIQTKTEKTKIEKWASPVLVSYELSLEMSWPHLLRHEMDLVGILHRAGEWPARMLHEAMAAVCTAGLPLLEGASEVSTAEQPPQKKQKDDKLPSAQLPTMQQSDGRADLQPLGSAESTKKSKLLVVCKGSDIPFVILTWGIRREDYLKFKFKQFFIKTVLIDDSQGLLPYQRYCPHLKKFVNYPKHMDKQYLLPGDTPVYREKGSTWNLSAAQIANIQVSATAHLPALMAAINTFAKNILTTPSSSSGGSQSTLLMPLTSLSSWVCDAASSSSSSRYVAKHSLSPDVGTEGRKFRLMDKGKAREVIECDIKLTDDEVEAEIIPNDNVLGEIIEIVDGKEYYYIM